MIISLLVAVDQAGGIGLQNKIPWHLSTDLRRFKTLTLGHHILMGRRTYESIGRPLPGRIMIVISRQPDYAPPRRNENVQVAPDLQAAIDLAERAGEQEAFVIGGGQIFREALPIADRIYLTEVNTTSEADIFFPPFEEDEWDEVSREEYPAGEKDEHAHTYRILERRHE